MIETAPAPAPPAGAAPPLNPGVVIDMQLVELDGTPGILPGESFDVELRFADVRGAANPQAAFAAYSDVVFDPALLRVDAVTYDTDFQNARTGSIDNAAAVDRAMVEHSESTLVRHTSAFVRRRR